MRWKVKKHIKPRVYSTRIIKRFTLFPIELKYEKRWLETVYIKQRYEMFEFIGGYSYLDWVNKEFVTKEKYLEYKNKDFVYE